MQIGCDIKLLYVQKTFFSYFNNAWFIRPHQSDVFSSTIGTFYQIQLPIRNFNWVTQEIALSRGKIEFMLILDSGIFESIQWNLSKIILYEQDEVQPLVNLFAKVITVIKI